MSSNSFCHIFTCNQVKPPGFQQFRGYLSKLSRKGEITITVEYFSSIFFKENKNVHIQFDIEHLFTFVMREKNKLCSPALVEFFRMRTLFLHDTYLIYKNIFLKSQDVRFRYTGAVISTRVLWTRERLVLCQFVWSQSCRGGLNNERRRCYVELASRHTVSRL